MRLLCVRVGDGNAREGGLRPRDPEWKTEVWGAARARELEREMGGSMMKGVLVERWWRVVMVVG